ncbi:MAG TPA: hypothetical protein VMU83_05135 [Hanamia sp.]|nr:hypothetical protein [Hanamia sp.]
MKRISIIFLFSVLLFSCKKESIDEETSVTVTDIDNSNHYYNIKQADIYGSNQSSITYVPFVTGIPPSPYMNVYRLLISLTGKGSEKNGNIIMLLPSLNLNNINLDTLYDTSFALEINSITYYASALHVNKIAISATPKTWPGESDNSSMSGKIDFSFDAVSTILINGIEVSGDELNKKIYVKGSFKNIFGTM